MSDYFNSIIGFFGVFACIFTFKSIITHNGGVQTIPADCFCVLGHNQSNTYDLQGRVDPHVKFEDVIAKFFAF